MRALVKHNLSSINCVLACLLFLSIILALYGIHFEDNCTHSTITNGKVQIEKVLEVPADTDLKYPGVADLPGYDVQGKIWVTGTEEEEIRAYFRNLDYEKIFKIVSPWTMVGKNSLRHVFDYVSHVNEQELEGDIVECGVWMGGATVTMMFAQLKSKHERDFWLFDTFSGLPPPSKKDDERSKRIYKQVITGTAHSRQRSGLVLNGKWNYGPKPIVKNLIRSTGYSLDKVHLVEGKVEDTLRSTHLPDKIAILRLDTDWYSSTKVELDLLWDRLISGGLLYIDDYCAWGGARKAVDEFFGKRGLQNLVAEAKKQRFCLSIVKP